MVKWLGFYRINWGNPCFLSRLFWWGDCWGHPLLQTGWYVLIGRNICWAIPHYVMSHLRRGVCDDIVILVYCAHVLRPSIQTGTDPVVIWMLTTEISGFSAAQSAQVSRKNIRSLHQDGRFHENSGRWPTKPGEIWRFKAQMLWNSQQRTIALTKTVNVLTSEKAATPEFAVHSRLASL